ncbi:hypothetical protein FOPE_07798 [Fonsecaea pedrosoi]|nr:hypothetical protein FOPE_07798 [Fonsecaea pedrosoi]
MSYQPMTPRLEDIPTDRRDLAHTMTYRSPPRLSRMADRNKDTIIEVSDDDSDAAPPRQLRKSLHRYPVNKALSTTSASDADVSELESAVKGRLTHEPRALKRTWTPSTSLDDSPQIAPEDRGKRRVNAPSDAMISTRRNEAGSGLQLWHHRHKRYVTVSKQPTVSAKSGTQHYAKSEKKAAPQPPYYVDGRLDLKMYRGPGYERFPVVLGTVDGHQELCDSWDAEQVLKLERKAFKLRQAIRTPYIIHGSDSETSNDEIEEVQGEKTFEKRCLACVIEVFPDIERTFVEKKIQDAPPQPQYFDEHDQEMIDTGAPSLAQRIIADILEMQAYPKQRPAHSKTTCKGAANDGTGITITWDRGLPKDKMYTKDAIILLAKHFVNVPTHYIAKVVEDKKSIFDSYVTIQGQEDRYYSLTPRPYKRYVKPRTEVEQTYQLAIGDRRIPAEYANRVNELQAAKQFSAREAIKEAVKTAKEEAEALNLAEHVKTGAVMECQCCFDSETPLNRIVACMADVPHFFCFTCVEGLADNQVGMLKYEMRCMDGDGCTAELSHEDVGRAVPITTFDRLELNKQQADIMAANIEGLEQCPHCEYKAICLDVGQEPIFLCQNPECSRATCRKCGKDSHIPKSCEENSLDKTLSARHLVEEARSEAIIRTCPKCKAKILKDFGCNKMVCTRCGCRMCYVCNADITHLGSNAYSHFGDKCVLYDELGINRHEREANAAEKGAITKAKEIDAELDETKLRIDTEKPANRRPSALLNHPAAEVFLRDLNNRAARLNNRQAYLHNLQTRVDRLQALRPDRELEDILAGVHRLDRARRHAERPQPNDSREHLTQLMELYQRARLNIIQHPPRLGEQLQQPPPPLGGHALVHGQYQAPPTAPFNPAVNPPSLIPPIPNRPVPAAAAFGDLAMARSNIPKVIIEDRRFGNSNLDFNFARAQATLPNPTGLVPVTRMAQEHRQVNQPLRRANNLSYGQYREAPYASRTAGTSMGSNNVRGPAGAAMPTHGLQNEHLSFAIPLAARNAASGITNEGVRDVPRS